jgi:hypothetical protein
MDTHKEIAYELLSIAESMLQELYLMKAHELVYDSFDVKINNLRVKLNKL